MWGLTAEIGFCLTDLKLMMFFFALFLGSDLKDNQIETIHEEVFQPLKSLEIL